jgi:hypothetical protein
MAADEIKFPAPHGAHLMDVIIGDKECGDGVTKWCFVITGNSSPNNMVYSKDDIRNEKLLPTE